MAERPSERPRVIVVGGGAGGLELAIGLAGLRRRKRLDVTLVDRQETHVWKPLLHEVASGSMYPSTDEVDYMALARWHGFTFCRGAFDGLDRNGRQVHVAAVCDEEGVVIPPRRLPFDVAVLALGSIANTFGVPGVADHTYSLDDVEEASDFHRRLVNKCLRANYADPPRRQQRIDVVIAGGGATGVELAAELRSTTRVLMDYGLDDLDADRFIRLTILNADPRVPQELPAGASDAIMDVLGGLGVVVRNSEEVVAVAADHVETKSGNRYPADLAVWAAGVKAPGSLKELAGLETNRHDQIVVTGTLQTTRDARVLAIGDCAAAPWIGKKGTVPPRAQAAEQQARYLVKAIPRMLAGKPVQPFRYNDFGSLVSLGEANTIGTVVGFMGGRRMRVDGLVARLIYRWLYKRHQAVLFGWGSAILATVGAWLRGATRPRVKLH